MTTVEVSKKFKPQQDVVKFEKFIKISFHENCLAWFSSSIHHALKSDKSIVDFIFSTAESISILILKNRMILHIGLSCTCDFAFDRYITAKIKWQASRALLNGSLYECPAIQSEGFVACIGYIQVHMLQCCQKLTNASLN